MFARPTRTPEPAPAAPIVTTPAPAAVEGAAVPLAWETYQDEAHGFSMLTPRRASVSRTDAGQWSVLRVRHEGLELLVLAQLDPEASEDEIEAFAAKEIGVAADRWKELGNSGGSGWDWRTTVTATDAGQVLYGGYGPGRAGSAWSCCARRRRTSRPAGASTFPGTSPSISSSLLGTFDALEGLD